MAKRRVKRKGNYDGQPGAAARAQSLTPERRKEIAKLAAAKRWANKGK